MKTKIRRTCENFSNLKNTNQFRKLGTDPTKSLENKVRQILLKTKNNLSETEYKKLYPAGSRLGLFYDTLKVLKVKQQKGLNKLTMRPIISNIGTATYETAKYFNKFSL